jgi:hypothetical protein
MRTAAAVHFTVIDEKTPGALRLRIHTDILNFQGSNYASQSLHTDLTPAEAKCLAADLILAANKIEAAEREKEWPEIPVLEPVTATVRKFTAPEFTKD